MHVTGDFYECLKDSPMFRHKLDKSQEIIDKFEIKVKQASKRCMSLLNQGRAYLQEFRFFADDLEKMFEECKDAGTSDHLLPCGNGNEGIQNCSLKNSMGFALSVIRNVIGLVAATLDKILSDSLKRLINLNQNDISQVRSQAKIYAKISEAYTNALLRNADKSAAGLRRRYGIDDVSSSKLLSQTRNQFTDSSIDYVLKLKCASIHFRTELLAIIKSIVGSLNEYFAKGSLLFEKSSSSMSQLNESFQFAVEHDALIMNETIDGHESAKRFCNTSMSLSVADANITTNLSKSLAGLSLNYKSTTTLANDSNGNRSPSIFDSSCTLSQSQCYHEGYLFKRSAGRFRYWTRKWFMLKDKKLLYLSENSPVGLHSNLHFRRRKKAQIPSSNRHWNRANIGNRTPGTLSEVVLIPDIRLCSIRESKNIDRLFVFEIQSPTCHYYFQAESSEERSRWIESTQRAIISELQSATSFEIATTSDLTSHVNYSNDTSVDENIRYAIIRERKEVIQTLPGNDRCCDCDAYRPEWVSINLGILLCLKCSGIHRGLGVNISKIRSLHIDDWDVETLIMLSDIGNQAFNSIFEANKDDPRWFKPSSSSPSMVRKRYIEAKYVQKHFVLKTPLNHYRNGNHGTIFDDLISNNTTNLEPDQFLRQSLMSNSESVCNIRAILLALSMGADRNAKYQTDNGDCPLILAIKSKNLSVCEFLLQNAVRVDQTDNDGLSALHHAVQQNSSHRCLVILLLKRHASIDIVDKCGKSPLDYALSKKDPDVTTWLRLVRLNQEMEGDDPELEKCFLPFLEDPAYLVELAQLYPL